MVRSWIVYELGSLLGFSVVIYCIVVVGVVFFPVIPFRLECSCSVICGLLYSHVVFH